MESPMADVFYVVPYLDVTRNTTLTEVSDEFMNTNMVTHFTGCLMIVASIVIVVTIFRFFEEKLEAAETNVVFDAERKSEALCLRTFESIRRKFPFLAVLDIFVRPMSFSYGEDPTDRRYINLANRILALAVVMLGVCSVTFAYIELDTRPSWTPMMNKWLCHANHKLEFGKRKPFVPCATPDCRDVENSPFSRMCSAEEEIGTTMSKERMHQLRVKLETDIPNEEKDNVYYQVILVVAVLEFFVAGAALSLHPSNKIGVNRPDLKFTFLLRSQLFYMLMFMCALLYLIVGFNFHILFFHYIETQTCVGPAEKTRFLNHFESPPDVGVIGLGVEMKESFGIGNGFD